MTLQVGADGPIGIDNGPGGPARQGDQISVRIWRNRERHSSGARASLGPSIVPETA
jgi:hypothetical protein